MSETVQIVYIVTFGVVAIAFMGMLYQLMKDK